MDEKYVDEYRNLGLRISYYRKMKKITQAKLSEKINKNTSFIGAIEAPNVVGRVPSLDTLFDIAKVLEVPAYKLLMFDFKEEK